MQSEASMSTHSCGNLNNDVLNESRNQKGQMTCGKSKPSKCKRTMWVSPSPLGSSQGPLTMLLPSWRPDSHRSPCAPKAVW